MALLRLRPNGNGSLTQHSRNAGAANWSRTSEASADDDTSFVYKTSSGSTIAVDTYALANSSGQIGTIKSVTLTARARHATKTGTAQTVLVIRPSSTNYFGPTEDLSGVYGEFTQAWVTNPGTAAAWTWANVDALQGGHESILDDDGITPTESRVTQFWADVDYNEAFDPIDVSGLALGSSGDPDFVPGGAPAPTAIGLSGTFRVTDALALTATVTDQLSLVSQAIEPGRTEGF